jgi:phenylacetate-coenzyme A ligase PaaK-like adenylate-forming protein
LMIMPRFVFSASEVLTDSTRKLATKAWGRSPHNVYAATETSGIAAECGEHTGMHLFEDLVITEVVGADNQPVPPGKYGAKVLVTVLFSRTVPLIRYEMSDSLQLGGNHHCPCGRPYALITGIQGREQELLTFPTSGVKFGPCNRSSSTTSWTAFTQRVGRSSRPAQVWRCCLLSRTRSTGQCWRVISARPWRPKESCRLRCTSIKWRPSRARL